MVIYNVINRNFALLDTDFKYFYGYGREVWSNPNDLYNVTLRNYYLPFVSFLFSISISLLPYTVAIYEWYFLNFGVLSVIFILEFNKILILKDVKKKLHRFIFLIIIANGQVVFWQIFMTHFKFIPAVIFFFIIRREMQYRKNELEKDTKYYIINYSLLGLAIAFCPYFIFFLIIYIFHDIKFRDLFSRINIKKYGLILVILLLENFLFFIFPSNLSVFVGTFIRHSEIERRWGFPLFYIREWEWLWSDDPSFYMPTIIISTIFIAILTLVLLVKNYNLKIEEKFSYLSLGFILFSTFAQRAFLVLFPLALLLFIPFLKQDVKGGRFLKENLIALIGIIALAGIYFMVRPDNYLLEMIDKYLPFLSQFPYVIIIYLRWFILLGIWMMCLIILYYKRFKRDIIKVVKDNNQFLS
ncbi:MAG: hypothetical protein ACFE9M_07185 [Promethearchaeota archaeon]